MAAQAKAQQQLLQDRPADETPEQQRQREQQLAEQREGVEQIREDLASLAQKLDELLEQRPELVEAARRYQVSVIVVYADFLRPRRRSISWVFSRLRLVAR